MALTLNGIAQGYITDRVARMLRDAGFRDLLIDLGEVRALGRAPGGRGWRVGLALGPGGTVTRRLELSDRAVATSAALGTVLDGAGRVGHILHPRRGAVAAPRAAVSVVDGSAAMADALSTAAVLMDEVAIAALAQGGTEVWL
jgi:thiamine biosynthesis lipoprotein